MKKWGERLTKVEQLAQSFRSKPLTTRYKPRLWLCQPASVWRLFPRQSVAISFAQSCKETVHVFALEKENSPPGQRIYLVTSYSELWHYYRTYTHSLMHCYEVIPEGSVCKLYFDLEFHKPSNKEAEGKTMVSRLIQHVCEKLMEVFGIPCAPCNVLNLDSSTEEKFSRHLIFNLKNAVFKDNIHVGRFVHAILQPILSTLKGGRPHNGRVDDGDACRASDFPGGSPAEASGTCGSPQTKRRKQQEEQDLQFLLVKNKDGQDCLFVDLGVYTKNRNFRLYKSSKAGKRTVFTVAEDSTFHAEPGKGMCAEESVFLASLVCNVSFTGQRILTWEVPGTKEAETLRPHCQQGSDTIQDLLSGSLSSPHQEVDNFVLTLVQKDGIQGSIRRWNYFAAEQLLVYDIVKYRWCKNVQRFHKSNNIMIIVDLKEEVWYQKCHDPECRNFRSSSYPLPREICLSYIMTQDEEDRDYLMDEAGNIEPSQTANTANVGEGSVDAWGDSQDDLKYAAGLEDFEQSGGEIPDHLLHTCMLEFES